ncbi:MAG: RNA methyltransferase [Candidatus Promineifilaceae bacterium]|nr:RNA methyltransferase [Candidatus Promineifilaceae bacterium]
MISSRSNQKVKYIRRLQSDRRFRRHEQAFVVEGTRWLKEFLVQPHRLKQIFYRADWAAAAENAHMLAHADVGKQSVSKEVMTAMSATETAPGILAVATVESLPIPTVPTLIVILDAINDPGNLGTILRSAAAAGVDAVLLGPGSVDIYNPKVVRSSMGALLRLPIHHLGWIQINKIVAGMDVWLAAGDGKKSYTAVDWRKPSALIVGNEAHGSSDKAQFLAESTIAIPMQSGTESLNAAMAASIIMFEAVRQRSLSATANEVVLNLK